jgi:hypothetical protein
MDMSNVREAMVVLLVIVLTFPTVILWAKIKKKRRG